MLREDGGGDVCLVARQRTKDPEGRAWGVGVYKTMLVMGPGPLCLLLFLLLTLCLLPPGSKALSRPVWYQVGLDLQPWGCQPPGEVGCDGGLSCSGQWMGLSTMGGVYPLTAVTVTVLIVVTHFVYQKRQVIFSRLLNSRKQSIVPPELLLPPKSGSPPSDRALLCNVLHMLANHSPPSASVSQTKCPSISSVNQIKSPPTSST
uniref:Transmembrane protein 89 n=1 Tax=Monodelphis domestica TaxID=13616 RepID=K7E5K7_MONDO